MTILGLVLIETVFFLAARSWSKMGAWVEVHVGHVGWGYFFLLAAYFVIGFSSLATGKFTILQVPVLLFLWAMFFQACRPSSKEFAGDSVPTIAVQSLFLVWLFATWMYPFVRAEWGGGQPINVVIRFTGSSGFLPSQKINAKLFDDSDSGILILQKDHKNVLFIPRADIAVISYSEDLSSAP